MKTILVLLILCSCRPALAHDLWCEPSDSGLTLRYGHLHSAHSGADEIAYDPAVVKRVRCFTAAGDTIAARHTITWPVRVITPAAATCILTSTGCWTKTPYGTRNVAPAEAEYPITSWLSFESVKWIGAWSTALAHPLTGGLEIVPLDDPAALKPGDKIHLLVAFDGKPLPGAVVLYAGRPRGTTGADGAINIRLKQPGLQIIQSSRSIPLDSGETDKVIYTANLNFTLEEDR